LTVVAGDGGEHRYRYADCASYAAAVRGRLGEFLREPVLVGLIAGAAYAWKTKRTAPLATLALALVAFALLALGGLPIITRYLLLPAALACVLAAAALIAGIEHRRWAPVSVLILILLVVFAPAQIDRIDRLERSIGIQEAILDDLDALPARAFACRPISTTNRRPVPHLALAFDLDPAAIRVGEVQSACTYVGPRTRAIAEDFIFDKKDPVRTLPRLPDDYTRVAGNRSWTVLSRGPAGATP
jgi:hypothetical protein